jgi:putative N6-adenine-specific DNA methylase
MDELRCAMDLEEFFLVVPPGLESYAARELVEKVPGLGQWKVELGGISVEAPFELGLAFNRVLKVPVAVRLRLASFKCRDLPKLFQKVSNIRWGRYLLGSAFQLNVSSSKSRLLHEKKIAKTISEGIERHFEKQPPKKVEDPVAFEVQVRFFDDICTISLDTSGEPLFKRGYKSLESAVAPIRENLAAGLFYALWTQLGGFTSLVDPMCGSGTFLLEAHQFWKPSTFRQFAFESQKSWKDSAIDLVPPVPALEQLYGWDQNPEPLQGLILTFQELNRGAKAEVPVQLGVKNILGAETFGGPSGSWALICNPPYGERLRLPMPPKVYFRSLAERLASLGPIGFGIILPGRYAELVPNHLSGYTRAEEIAFKNGGLPVVFRVYKRR